MAEMKRFGGGRSRPTFTFAPRTTFLHIYTVLRWDFQPWILHLSLPLSTIVYKFNIYIYLSRKRRTGALSGRPSPLVARLYHRSLLEALTCHCHLEIKLELLGVHGIHLIGPVYKAMNSVLALYPNSYRNEHFMPYLEAHLKRVAISGTGTGSYSTSST